MHIILETLEVFSFTNIDIINKKFSFFFKYFVQIVTRLIKTSAIFNSNSRSNVGSFSYFSFANNILKCYVELLYQNKIIVLSKIICQVFKINADVILNNL